MKIYTKTGDAGETGLYRGGRVRKDHWRIEAYGTVDELNAVLGMVRAESLPAEVDALLARVQNELFDVGAELATSQSRPEDVPSIDARAVADLEAAIDRHELTLTPLKQFILPGGASAAAGLHLARTVCRRAERRVISLAAAESVRGDLIVYLNRLSDLLFVLARVVNAAADQADVPWEKRT